MNVLLHCIVLRVSIVHSKLCACARVQVVKRAHTRKLGAHKTFPLKNLFCTYFMHNAQLHIFLYTDESW